MKRKAKFSSGQVVMNREYESGKLVDERTIKLKCPDRDHKGDPIWIDTWGNCYEESHLRPLTRREKDAIARERDEVTEKLAEALDFMYQYFVMPGHPERAKDCPNKDCPFCKADEALAAYRERMGR